MPYENPEYYNITENKYNLRASEEKKSDTASAKTNNAKDSMRMMPIVENDIFTTNKKSTGKRGGFKFNQADDLKEIMSDLDA